MFEPAIPADTQVTTLTKRPTSLAELIEDVLETEYGRWMTADQITDRIMEMRPVLLQSVARSLHRAFKEGTVQAERIESRLIGTGPDHKREYRITKRRYE